MLKGIDSKLNDGFRARNGNEVEEVDDFLTSKMIDRRSETKIVMRILQMKDLKDDLKAGVGNAKDIKLLEKWKKEEEMDESEETLSYKLRIYIVKVLKRKIIEHNFPEI